ncbi:hypothetical protein [Streptomyces asoensis]|uniref:hypothetical protein n=1 Tax=Streptomyces asoensis TaxID=249586 RepID=UPI003D9E9737
MSERLTGASQSPISTNTVERAINRSKNSRAVATRYDKHGYVFLETVTAAGLVIWLRS